jgi:hypothetical protein
MIDTTPVTRELTKLISTGTTEQVLLVTVAHLFPNSLAEAHPSMWAPFVVVGEGAAIR